MATSTSPEIIVIDDISSDDEQLDVTTSSAGTLDQTVEQQSPCIEENSVIVSNEANEDGLYNTSLNLSNVFDDDDIFECDSAGAVPSAASTSLKPVPCEVMKSSKTPGNTSYIVRDITVPQMTTIKRKKVENSEQESKIQKLGPGALAAAKEQIFEGTASIKYSSVEVSKTTDSDVSKRQNGFFKYEEVEMIFEMSQKHSDLANFIASTIQEEKVQGVQKACKFNVLYECHTLKHSLWWAHRTNKKREIWPWNVFLLHGEEFYTKLSADENSASCHAPNGIHGLIQQGKQFQKNMPYFHDSGCDENTKFGNNDIASRPRLFVFVYDWSKSLLSAQRGKYRCRKDFFTEKNIKKCVHRLQIFHDC